MNINEFIYSTKNKTLKVSDDQRIKSNDFGEFFHISTFSFIIIKLIDSFGEELEMKELSLFLGNVFHSIYLEKTVRYDILAMSPRLYSQCAEALVFLEQTSFMTSSNDGKIFTITERGKLFIKTSKLSEIKLLNSKIDYEIKNLKKGVIKFI